MRSFIDQFNTGYIDSESKRLVISPGETALIVAILSAGTFTGSLLAAPFADWIGRRLSLITSIGVFCFGVIFQVCANSIPMLLAGRYVEIAARAENLVIDKHLLDTGPVLALEPCPFRFPCTNPRWPQNGSAAHSYAHTNFPSLLVF